MRSKIVGTWLLAMLGVACSPPGQIVSRSVNAVAAGGPQEVWLVMGETGARVDGNEATIDRDVYVVYHCIPAGCKRVGELQGTQAFERSEVSR